VRYAREQAKEAKAQHEAEQIALAVSMLASDTGQWPGHQAEGAVAAAAGNEVCGADADTNSCASHLTDGSSGLAGDDAGNPFSGWAGPYMPQIPADPWGREYFFDSDYELDYAGLPCGCGGCTCGSDCQLAAVSGSYGPDGLGVPDENAGTAGSYGCDDIIKVIQY
jgi:hypothetical protein